MSIRLGIYGYGNLGKGVEYAISQNKDLELCAVFTRRPPDTLHIKSEGVPVVSSSLVDSYADKIDVLILCGGSATDLPLQSPKLASLFNIVDSFDTHANIPAHFEKVDKAAMAAGKTAVISAGWDPGLFSLARVYFSSVLPEGNDYTFWGRGVSQGHSDAIRRINGVLDARQYTVPRPEALNRVKNGENPSLSTREKHLRECYVVASPDADKKTIEKEIKEMPNYFSDYDTTVTFITKEEMEKNHSGLPHGGLVLRNGKTGDGSRRHTMEFSLRLDSNPEFTGSVLCACARAVYRMNGMNMRGCYTLPDIPPAMLSPLSREDILKKLI